MKYWDVPWNGALGCSKISPGCTYCYAEKLHTQRHVALLENKKVPECYRKPFNEIQLLEDRLDIPLRRKKPTVFFVCNMGDLFHPDVPFEFADKVFAVMALCPQHTFLVLTKRTKSMARYFQGISCDDGRVHEIAHELMRPPFGLWTDADNVYDTAVAAIYENFPNLWLGTTVCNQAEADKNIPLLLQTPAAHRFLSIEPMLGEINIQQTYGDSYYCSKCGYCGEMDRRCCVECSNEVDGCQYDETDDGDCSKCDQGTMTAACPKCKTYSGQDDGEGFAMIECFYEKPLPGIDQVILGGETGKNARPMHPDWARGVRDLCEAACVPFMFKQNGEFKPDGKPLGNFCDGKTVYLDIGGQVHTGMVSNTTIIRDKCEIMLRVGKKRAGRLLDGVEHNDLVWSVKQ